MATSVEKKRGSSTTEYKAVRSNYLNLALSFEQVLPRLTSKCFERDLISVNEREYINNEKQLSKGSTLLLDCILHKIELDQEWYEKFSLILDGFSELKDIRCEVNETLKLSRRHNISESRSEDSGFIDGRLPDLAKGSERTMSPSPLTIPDHNSSSSTASQKENLSSHHKIQEWESIIEKLRKDCDQKDKVVRDLESDRAEKEKIIKVLEASCEEAEKRAKEDKLTIESNQKKHKNEIQELQQYINTLKLKERDARLELGEARNQLMEAELKKEKFNT